MIRCAEQTIWKIFAREGKNGEDYADTCFRTGVIAVGWSDLDDLNIFSSYVELKQTMLRYYRSSYHDNLRGLAQGASSLWRFREDVKKDDWVICPYKTSRIYYIGKILSERVFYDEKPLYNTCYFAHRRYVNWSPQVLSFDDYGPLGGQPTVARLLFVPRKLDVLTKENLNVINGRLPLSMSNFSNETEDEYEYERKKKVVCTKIHAKAINVLAKMLKERGYNISNNKCVDLCIFDSNGRMKFLFECKADTEPYSIYTAIGQLKFHSANNDPIPQGIIFLPALPDDKLERIINSIGLKVLPYQVYGNKISIQESDLDKILSFGDSLEWRLR